MMEYKNRRCALCTLLAVILAVAVVSGISVWVIIHGAPRTTKYMVVLDAGSTHTALYVYKWNDREKADGRTNHHLVRRIEQIANKYCEKKGFASYADSSAIPGKLESCLAYAMEHVPTSHAPSTEVHVGGTAGLRLLRSDNMTAANGVLDAIRDGIRNYSTFQLVPENVRIISGEEEGFYGWATANYLAGTFPMFQSSNFSELVNSTISKTPYGFLQLGGASAQIAFTPPNPFREFSNDSSKYHVPADIFGEDVQLYSQSFLCHGLKEAARTYRATLIAEQNFPIVIDPCFPRGGQIETNDSHLFGHHYCSGEFNTTLKGPKGELYLVGSGDYQGCREAVFRLLKKTSCSDPDLECSLKGIRRPVIQGPFLAFSGYYHVIKVFQYLAKKNTSEHSVNLNEFRNVTKQHCSVPFEKLEEIFEKQNLTKKLINYMETFCFTAIYIDTVLTSGYGFNETTFANIRFLKDVEGTEFGWPLGLVLQVTMSRNNTKQESSTTVW
ncbi:hypothetical protein RvY_07774 [Ramazzottius varieornatus]|uniref:Ectonucleoside triphosphate diphosphohydrolase 1 n=1 Tax=Ramazzottius varieornatus TaxID=947166 RepID=A0A1D1V3N5_RAMVA|nr:hypothetical protein RvY_07774 [Ramazzottius varieornatus]